MSCSPPLAKQAKLFCPINSLADSDLEEIFQRLPPYERLIVSAVCRRWHQISREAWLDIRKIDLKPIPGKHIGAIVNQCPNLQSVFAVSKTFDPNELTCLAKVPSLKRVSFVGCDFKLNPDKPNIEQNIFSDSLGDASWTELVLHDARFFAPLATAAVGVVPLGTAFLFNVANLPSSLTHLQLSGLCLCEEFYSVSRICLSGLERLENLGCFILHTTIDRRKLPAHYNLARELVEDALLQPRVFEKIVRLHNLKELCVNPAIWLSDQLPLTQLTSGLPKLEVLFLRHVNGQNGFAEDLAELMTTNSVLRILVLSGVFPVDESIELPARKRFPHGFGSEPLPLLHVFVGKAASENIRFTKSTSDASIIHPINQPAAEFLEREDIAPIFKGVWVAEKIKETARYGDKVWRYDFYDVASFIQHI